MPSCLAHMNREKEVNTNIYRSKLNDGYNAKVITPALCVVYVCPNYKRIEESRGGCNAVVSELV